MSEMSPIAPGFQATYLDAAIPSVLWALSSDWTGMC